MKVFQPLSTAAVITCLFSVHIHTIFFDFDVVIAHILATLLTRDIVPFLLEKSAYLQFFHLPTEKENKESTFDTLYCCDLETYINN